MISKIHFAGDHDYLLLEVTKNTNDSSFVIFRKEREQKQRGCSLANAPKNSNPVHARKKFLPINWGETLCNCPRVAEILSSKITESVLYYDWINRLLKPINSYPVKMKILLSRHYLCRHRKIWPMQ